LDKESFGIQWIGGCIDPVEDIVVTVEDLHRIKLTADSK
jgi:hypothetical protein